MKLLLLSALCVAAAVAEVLPGDPRYGTDYRQHHHHQHEHHAQDNEIQVSKAVGGYVGSYNIPDNSIQVPHTRYGPPGYQPSEPINNIYLPPRSETKKVPVIKTPTSVYGGPIQQPTEEHGTVVAPAVEDLKRTSAPTTSYRVPQVPSTSYGTPVTNVKTNVRQSATGDYTAPHVDAPVTSYGSPVVADLKTVQHETRVQKPVPEVKTVQEHVHVEQTKTVQKPEVVAVPQSTVSQVTHHQTSGIRTVPSRSHFGDISTSLFDSNVASTDFGSYSSGLRASDFSGLSSYDTSSYTSGIPAVSVHSSYPTYATNYHQVNSYTSQIPLKTVDHHVHVPVSQPFPVEIPREISYPVPVAQPVDVPRPYYYRVPQPVQLHVPQPVQLHVPQHVHVSRPSAPVVHYVRTSVPSVPSVAHEPIADQRGNPISDFFGTNFPNFQFPSVPSFPQVPVLSDFFNPTPAPAVTPAPVALVQKSYPVHVDKESVQVENVELKKTPVVTKVAPTHAPKLVKEYVQPTASNGGYIY